MLNSFFTRLAWGRRGYIPDLPMFPKLNTAHENSSIHSISSLVAFHSRLQERAANQLASVHYLRLPSGQPQLYVANRYGCMVAVRGRRSVGVLG